MRTVILGAVAASALLAAFVARPVARRWAQREDAIAAARERASRLRGLMADEGALQVAAAKAESTGDGPRALRGRTGALAASILQETLQGLARTSRVSVARLDVSQTPDMLAGDLRLTASMSAVTDIYGLADLLTRMQRSAVVLEIDEVTVAPNPVLRGNLLQLVLVIRAPVLLDS